MKTKMTFDQLRKQIHKARLQGKTLRQIALEDFNGAVTHGVIQRVLNGVEPKSVKIRMALGLTSLKPAPVCPECGVVHVSKRCPERVTCHKDLFAIPPRRLLEMLENRKEVL